MPPPFDWTQYLILAKDLSTRSEEEAALRSAISRAYYAAFNQARAYCATKEIEISKASDSHQVVWRVFDAGRTLRGIHVNGIRLMRRRVQADYDPEFEELAANVGTAVHECELVLNYLAAALGHTS